MKIFSLILTTIFASGLFGCASAVEGRYGYRTEADYSRLNTFALLPFDEGKFSSPESAAHYRENMVSELSAKGFTENPENPDFLIDTVSVRTYTEHYVDIYGDLESQEAMWRINFTDPSTGESIYEAAAKADFEASLPQEDKNKLIEKAVKVIVNGFPPSWE